MKTLFQLAVALVAAGACAEMRPDGHFGKRLDKMLANHVEATDPVKLAALYREETKGHWQTEFWGKYMHAAVPFWRYTGSERLGAKIAAGVQAILAVQEPGGYIGNYAPANRYGRGWDVWGTKYTLMGLLHYYDATGDAKTLEAAKRLCDYLIAERGPKGHRELRFTGQYGGLPSLSVLEPVVWLYNRTKEPRFLAFADYIVKQMTEYPDGPELVKQADVPVADRRLTVVDKYHSWNPEHALTKAYELMSCYQGLIEYYEATGKKEYLDAAVKTARNIAETEVNLAGGSAAGAAVSSGVSENDGSTEVRSSSGRAMAWPGESQPRRTATATSAAWNTSAQAKAQSPRMTACRISRLQRISRSPGS